MKLLRSSSSAVHPFGILMLIALFGLACGSNPEATPEPVAEPSPAASDSLAVYFISPADGAVVGQTFPVQMGVKGLTVEPAGPIRDHAGHLHILVDTDYVAPGLVIPNDEKHLHYGTGALEAELTLPPGRHTLRLQFADGAHRALDGSVYQDEVTVTVE